MRASDPVVHWIDFILLQRGCCYDREPMRAASAGPPVPAGLNKWGRTAGAGAIWKATPGPSVGRLVVQLFHIFEAQQATESAFGAKWESELKPVRSMLSQSFDDKRHTSCTFSDWMNAGRQVQNWRHYCEVEPHTSFVSLILSRNAATDFYLNYILDDLNVDLLLAAWLATNVVHERKKRSLKKQRKRRYIVITASRWKGVLEGYRESIEELACMNLPQGDKVKQVLQVGKNPCGKQDLTEQMFD